MAKKPSKKAAKKPAAAAAPKAPTRKAAASSAAPAAPAASTAVLDELLKITSQPAPKADETLPDFVLRVATAMAEVPDDKFQGLSPDSRKWYDENFERYNSEQHDKLVALPGMPGYAAPAAEAAPQSAAPAPAAKEDKTPETPQPEAKDDDMAKAKGAKKGAKKETNGTGERALRTDSTSYKVRQAVVKQPDIEFDKLCTKLGIKGKEAAPTGHVHNMFQHAKIVMKIAAAEGYKAK